MSAAVAVFTRDLRVHDNPMLAAAARAGKVVPLFVVDEKISVPDGRARFLAESLADLDRSLRERGGALVVRSGDPVDQIRRVAEEVGAERVHIAADVSGYAQARESALRSALGRAVLHSHDDVHTIVPPGFLAPQGKDHFSVFTPYYRRWREVPWRRSLAPPEAIRLPAIDAGDLPQASGGGFPGGETAGRRRLGDWVAGPVRDYARRHDLLAEEGTSRLSAYLHFGCVSALEAARRAGDEAFVRQLAWRDFHHQVLAARPDAAYRDYRGRGDRWRDDEEALDAWRAGRTGIPIVDAGMRQLLAEGWMHNRARMITASFLTKTLYLDWRTGARHFLDHLLDADIANNNLNWQWVAGTGTDTRPNRVLNPLRQAERFDPDGDYVRRYVPELAGLAAPGIHRPWRSRTPGYPAPIVDLEEARRRFLTARR
ncbi:cryptochrome/photolyase family protein [Amycolatopsis pigmentata]|uniref:Cryptochrome/photolyase family protein n=1 Tax=Amycolatopsis pigmentata TaxID=450801 RepID=A0ABW5G0V2_9PSEU